MGWSCFIINKSAKLDVLSMVLYLLVLLIIVKKTQIYAIPIAAFVSGIVFVGLYLLLLKTQLHVDIQSIIKLSTCLLITTIPFPLLHSIFKINLMNLSHLITYGLLFSIIYFTIIGITNKSVVLMLTSKLRHGN